MVREGDLLFFALGTGEYNELACESRPLRWQPIAGLDTVLEYLGNSAVSRSFSSAQGASPAAASPASLAQCRSCCAA